jgi:hypothetical protein
MKNILKLLLMVLLPAFMACKTPEWNINTYESVRWNDAETRIHAFFTAEREEKLSIEKNYAWFDKGVIGSTQGGYSGKLLHGKYVAWYSSSRQLKEQGFYARGLKDGVWLLWQEDGRLKEKQKWKAGKQILPREKVGLLKRIKNIWPKPAKP